MVSFGRESCGVLDAALRREWLVTNGIGGYASGTISGAATRRYHGLLLAALHPPLGRTLVCAKLDEWVEHEGVAYPLACNVFQDGTVDPRGYHNLESFELDGTIPVWRYALADCLLEKRVFMAHGHNTTYITYRMLRGEQPVRLAVLGLFTHRDYHDLLESPAWSPHLEICAEESAVTGTYLADGTLDGIVQVFDDATPVYIRCQVTDGSGRLVSSIQIEVLGDTYKNFFYSVERERGQDDHEDLLAVGRAYFEFGPDQLVSLTITTETSQPDGAWTVLAAERTRQAELMARAGVGHEPAWVQQLVLAADQFVVARGEGHTVIAGYPWFTDWGRDTMISLPGLTLSTGRPELAVSLLRTFARHVSQGMLPNRFPDAGEALGDQDYNTVDATLWYFEAVRATVEATGDDALLRELYPILADILAWHERGTRFGIRVDPADGLLYAGEPGVQLTWMDAKVDDWVVTPRQGKAVEINALWYHALHVMASFAERLGEPAQPYRARAARVQAAFAKFWNDAAGWCFDVIGGPHGNDAALRPNQLLAVSLQPSPLTPDQQKQVVDSCARYLVTSMGLRSLAPFEPGYVGIYTGDRYARDGAYHQGTVWAWLIGPFVEAHLRVYADPVLARSFLDPFSHFMLDAGLGSISEIADGDPPFTPRGCPWQAWSVAEALRAWRLCRPT